MAQDISMEELEAAMAEGFDEDGNDLRLAESVARMTPQERRAAEENLRRSLAEARASLRDRARVDDV